MQKWDRIGFTIRNGPTYAMCDKRDFPNVELPISIFTSKSNPIPTISEFWFVRWYRSALVYPAPKHINAFLRDIFNNFYLHIFSIDNPDNRKAQTLSRDGTTRPRYPIVRELFSVEKAMRSYRIRDGHLNFAIQAT